MAYRADTNHYIPYWKAVNGGYIIPKGARAIGNLCSLHDVDMNQWDFRFTPKVFDTRSICNYYIDYGLHDNISPMLENNICTESCYVNSYTPECDGLIYPQHCFDDKYLLSPLGYIDEYSLNSEDYSWMNKPVINPFEQIKGTHFHNYQKVVASKESELSSLKKFATKIKLRKVQKRQWDSRINWEQVLTKLEHAKPKNLKEDILDRIDKQLNLLANCDKAEIKAVSSQLKSTRDKYAIHGEVTLLTRICYLIFRIRILIENQLHTYIQNAKSLISYVFTRFLFLYKLDKRTLHRRIIRFLFKNLNDKSGTDDNTVYQSMMLSYYSLLKQRYHVFKTRSNYTTRVFT